MTSVPGYTAFQRGRAFGLADLAAVAAFVGLYSSAVYYLFNNGVAYLQPNYAYTLIYLAGAYVYLTGSAARHALSPHAGMITLWVILIILMSAQYALFEISAEGTGLFTGRVHFLLTLISTLLLFSASANLERLVSILGLVVAAVSAINVFEFFFAGSLIDWMSNVPGRAAGFYENANDSAMFIGLAVPLVAIRWSGASRWLFYALAFSGVYLTFSRGGLALLAVAICFAELARGTPRSGWALRVLVLSSVTLCGLVVLSFVSSEMSGAVSDLLWPYLDANTAARIEFLSNDSTNERMILLERGLEGFAHSPLFGNGVGYTHSWEASASTHNLLVLMLAELGLVGGAWTVAFLYFLWTYPRPYGGILVALVATSSLFSHNHLERPALALLLALYFVVATAKSRQSLAR